MSGRCLRALVVHDTLFPDDVPAAVLGTAAVELCEVRFPDDVRQARLSTLGDVLSVLTGLRYPDNDDGAILPKPDLLLIDCHFDGDTLAPNVREHVQTGVDPRGLCYGAVLAAFFLGHEPARPFAFSVYSQAMSTAAADPYAQTFYSMLLALSGQWQAPLARSAGLRRRMEDMPERALPDLALSVALREYRSSLLRVFQDQLHPYLDTFEKARAVVGGILSSSRIEEPNIGVAWMTADGKRECILLHSLFADCLNDHTGCLDGELLRQQDALAFFDQVLEEANPKVVLLRPVEHHLDALERDTRPAWPRGHAGYQQKVLAYLILWALARYKRMPATVAALNASIKLDNIEVNRALGAILGNDDAARDPTKAPLYPAKLFIDTLTNRREWPYPQIFVLRELVRELLRKRMVPRDDWPPCLREPP